MSQIPTSDPFAFDLGFEAVPSQEIEGVLLLPAQTLNQLHSVLDAEIRVCLAKAQITASRCESCVRDAVAISLQSAQATLDSVNYDVQAVTSGLLSTAWEMAAKLGCVPAMPLNEPDDTSGTADANDLSTYAVAPTIDYGGKLESLRKRIILNRGDGSCAIAWIFHPDDRPDPSWYRSGSTLEGWPIYVEREGTTDECQSVVSGDTEGNGDAYGCPPGTRYGQKEDGTYGCITPDALPPPPPPWEPPYTGPLCDIVASPDLAWGIVFRNGAENAHFAHGSACHPTWTIPSWNVGRIGPAEDYYRPVPAGWYAVRLVGTLGGTEHGEVTLRWVDTSDAIYAGGHIEGGPFSDAEIDACPCPPVDRPPPPIPCPEKSNPCFVQVGTDANNCPIYGPGPTCDQPPPPPPPDCPPCPEPPPPPKEQPTDECGKPLETTGPMGGRLDVGSELFCADLKTLRDMLNKQGLTLLESALNLGGIVEKTEVNWINTLEYVFNAIPGARLLGLKLDVDLPIEKLKCHVRNVYGYVRSLGYCNQESWAGLTIIRAIVTCLHNVRVGTDLALWATTDFNVDFGPLLRFIDYLINWSCPNVIVSQAEAINLYLTGQVTLDHCRCLVELNGGVWELAYKLIQGQRARPNQHEVIQLYNREYINTEEYKRRMRDLGYIDEDDISSQRELSRFIPGPADLIRFMVRDAFDDKTSGKYQYDAEFPEKFTKQAQQWAMAQGMDERTFRYYWRSHWDLPSNTALYEMVHRLRPGRVDPDLQVTEQDAYELMGINDIAPGWRKKLLAITYRPLTRVDARKAFNIGQISEQEFRNVLLDIGYSQESADYLVELGKRDRIKQIKLSSFAKLYRKGGLSNAKATVGLVDLGYPPPVVESVLAEIEMEIAAESRAACVQGIRARYKTGELTSEQAATALLQLDVGGERAAIWVAQWTCEIQSKGKVFTAKELCGYLEEGLMTAEETAIRLTRLGYSAQDAQRILESCQRQISRRQATRVLKAQLEAEKAAKKASRDVQDACKRREAMARARMTALARRERSAGQESDMRLKTVARYVKATSGDPDKVRDQFATLAERIKTVYGLSEGRAWKALANLVDAMPEGGYVDLDSAADSFGRAMAETQVDVGEDMPPIIQGVCDGQVS